MSVFKVKLNNRLQGNMDLNPATGAQFDVSNTRQLFTTGPRGSYRLLRDGEVFEDCNYWKNFTASAIGEELSFIEVIEDDGSIYSEDPSLNTFMVGDTLTLSTSFDGGVIDYIADYNSPAVFLSVQNNSETIAVTGELNGNPDLTFTVGAGETYIFSKGDAVITKLRLKGDSGTPEVTVLASVNNSCGS